MLRRQHLCCTASLKLEGGFGLVDEHPPGLSGTPVTTMLRFIHESIVQNVFPFFSIVFKSFKTINKACLGYFAGRLLCNL